MILFAVSASAQTVKDNESPAEEVFTMVEQMPQYPAGDDALFKFIRDNVRYPKKAMDDGTEGRVIVRFIVSKTGALENFEVKRSVSPEIDEEALRVIRSMPDWIPGKQNGRPVAVYMMLPVEFQISD